MRTCLSSDTTFYIRPDGNDSNDGLANTAGHAFLTLQSAYDQVQRGYDAAGFKVKFKLSPATYTAGLYCQAKIIGLRTVSDCIIEGEPSNPGMVHISTVGDCFDIGWSRSGDAWVHLDGLKLSSSQSRGILANGAVSVEYTNILFGALPAGAHVMATHNAWVLASGNNTISSGGFIHAVAAGNALLAMHGSSLTFSGASPFSVAFAYAESGGLLYANNMTFVNVAYATGQRYAVSTNAIINGYGGASYLPGSVAGVASSGGQYW